MIPQFHWHNTRSTDLSTATLNPYKLAWAGSLDGKVIIAIPSGRVLDCNPAAEALMQLPKDELLSKSVYDLVPEEEKLRITEEMGRLGLGPSKVHGFHAVTSDGRSVPIVVSTSAVTELADGTLISICEFRDVSLEINQEHRLATKRWALSAYASAAVTLSRQHSRASLLTAICEAIVTEPKYVFSWIAIAENDPEKSISVAAQAGRGVGILDGIHMTWSAEGPGTQGPAPTAIRTGKLQTLDDTRQNPEQNRWTRRFNEYGILSCAFIPFRSGDGLSGAIVVCSDRARAFEPIALEVFTHLAEQVGRGLHAIEQQEMLEAERVHSAASDRQLVEAMSLMMQPLSLTMEMRDPYTAGHQNRVAEIAVAIASEMGWPLERQQGLRLAAQVHDIGKMSIPYEIVTKSGSLSNTERALMNEHSENGYNILKAVPFPWPIATIVRQHHEKLDGSGYPQGLAAKEILPESKIMVVADMFEAMTAERPYRFGMPAETVLSLLEADAGTKLDADAVRICASLCRQGRFQHLLRK